MSFQTRSEFINAQASEKITLIHVHGSNRVVNWTVFSGPIYYKDVSNFVYEVAKDTTSLTRVDTVGSMSAGTFHYDIQNGRLYVWNAANENPDDEEMVVTYRFFFSNAPVDLSWDLTLIGNHVHYDGRVISNPGYKHKIGIDQKLTSLVGSGKLVLENTDGGLDSIFDQFFFENKQVEVYSWHREIPYDQAKIIFRGRVTDKEFSDTRITYTIKDEVFSLQENVPQTAYTDDDSVIDSVKGRYKRWIYGRVDGLQLQSVDQIGEGYTLTGTVSAAVVSTTLTGTGTSFLSECSPGDIITIQTQEFTIESIQSDTSLTLDNETTYSFSDQTATLKPEIPVTTKNREFFVAGHACTELTKTVADIKQFNRIELSDTIGLQAGDFIEFTTGERIEIKNVAPGNIVVLRQNVIQLPTVGSNVIRQPVQELFVGSERVGAERFTISNTGGSTNELKVTLDSDVEFQIAKTKNLGFDLAFTNGSRSVTTPSSVDLTEVLQPRDWVRPEDISYTTFYEVLSVSETSLELRAAFADPTHSGPAEGKLPDYIGDDTIVSANVIGKTDDGEPDGQWLSTAADVTRDLLREIGIAAVDEASFTQGSLDNDMTMSIAIPATPSGKAETVKSVIDRVSKSTFTSLTLDNDLNIKFKALQVEAPTDIVTISDKDLISWKVRTVNGDNIRNSLINYKFKDIDRFTLERANNTVTYSSDFVQKYIGTNKSDEIDAYLYNQTDAEIMSHRVTYYRSLGRSDITITTDLRLENIEIGDYVTLDFPRLYKRLGDSGSTKKILIVVGKEVTGDRIKLTMSDLGNTFNRSSIITDNAAPDYSAATEDEKLINGHITDTNGVVNNDDNTVNIHKIS